MGLTSYDDAVKGTTGCIAFWSLDGNTNDTKGTNHMSVGTPGTYVGGIDGAQAMRFNGSTNIITSASTIDLTATQKITLSCFCNISTYGLTALQSIIESGTASVAGDFGFFINGTIANDPVVIAEFGNVGLNNADFYPSTFGWATSKWYHFTIVYDFSVAAANEVLLYLNGTLLTADAKRNSSENTGSFGNKVMSMGARTGGSLYTNVVLSKVALFNTALTATQILNLYQTSQLGLIVRPKKSLAQKSVHTLKVE